jgi:hypothetical protein
MPAPPKVVTLDEIEPIPGPGRSRGSRSATRSAFGPSAATRTSPARLGRTWSSRTPRTRSWPTRSSTSWPGEAPDSPSLRYNLACLEALTGNREQALASLRRALELRAELSHWTREDDDLESLRDDPEFRALTGS